LPRAPRRRATAAAGNDGGATHATAVVAPAAFRRRSATPNFRTWPRMRFALPPCLARLAAEPPRRPKRGATATTLPSLSAASIPGRSAAEQRADLRRLDAEHFASRLPRAPRRWATAAAATAGLPTAASIRRVPPPERRTELRAWSQAPVRARAVMAGASVAERPPPQERGGSARLRRGAPKLSSTGTELLARHQASEAPEP
jgi:hypothetical protein